MLSEKEIKEYKAGWKKRKLKKEKKYRQKKEEGRQKAFKIARFLKNEYDINKVILFGSLSKKSDRQLHEHSDIDLVYDGNKIDYLDMIGKAADIAAPFKVDILPLSEASPALKKRIKYYGEEL